MEAIRKKNNGWTTYQARKIAGISIRRTNQIWQIYCQTGSAPFLGNHLGRLKRPILGHEATMVKDAYLRYRVSASTLETITLEAMIQRDYGVHLPHHHIHLIMLSLGAFAWHGQKEK